MPSNMHLRGRIMNLRMVNLCLSIPARPSLYSAVTDLQSLRHCVYRPREGFYRYRLSNFEIFGILFSFYFQKMQI